MGQLPQEILVTRFNRAARLFALSAACLVAAGSASAAEREPSPKLLAQAFADFCLAGSGMPLETARAAAIEAGWVPQGARITSTATGRRLDRTAAGPRFLRRGELTLSLVADGAGGLVCSVSAAFGSALTVTRLASSIENGGKPDELAVQSDEASEKAAWSMGALRIEASVRRDNSLRHAKLLARSAQRQVAFRD
jgi:hypothetical protein